MVEAFSNVMNWLVIVETLKFKDFPNKSGFLMISLNEITLLIALIYT